MVPLLIGQAPGLNTRPDLPLYPVPATMTGGRLAALMGLTPREYLVRFERINLLQEYPGRTGRDDKFPMGVARAAAGAIKPLLSDRVVVLVGRNVANAFGHDTPFHQWSEPGFCRMLAVVPHPSGRNHWYNDPANRELAQDFWRDVLSRHIPDTSLLPSVFSRRIQQDSLLRARQELTT